ncbi:MAG: glycosyltransferase family 39 protein [Clostridia bacterium]|nr:glycosyltransferase family 39 protein [Clostridia bacterium]
MKKEKLSIQNLIEYLILFGTTVLFLLLFSFWTTPLLPKWYGCDASFFSMAGRGILNGWVPYRDFFDLKGPYFFFLQALGQLICKGRTGIFLLQIPFLYASVILIYQIAQLYLSKLKSVFIIIQFYFLHLTMIWGGNTLEEFCLPLSLLCMYLAMKRIKDQTFKHMPVTSFIFGLCMGIIVFSKITVASVIAGIILAFALLYLLDHEWKEFFKFCIYVLGGLAVAALPLIIYFSLNHTLGDMFYAVFMFGFKRSIDFDELFNLSWELKLSGCIFAFLVALLYRKELKREHRLILMFSSVITYLLLHFGTPFVYYFTTTIPVLVMALVLFLKINQPFIISFKKRQLVCLIAFFAILGYYEDSSVSSIKTAIYDRNDPYYEEYYQNAVNLAMLIPEWEQGEVYCYNVDMIWFEITGMLPDYKYPVNTPFFAQLSPKIKEDLIQYMENTPPKWLLTSNHVHEELDFIGEQIDQSYQFVYSNDLGTLYLREE